DGARVSVADSGEAALAALDRGEFDLVILDIDLPGRSGFETLRRLRERSGLPVIITTSKGNVADRVSGLDLGADDYLLKPAEVPELGRRARALLRRARGTEGFAVEELEGPGGLVLRLRSHEVLVQRVPLELTPKEFAVLRLLLHRRGEVVSPDALSLAIWGYETFGSRNFVEAHISRLRAKLARSGAGQIVTTIRGVGYVIR
ncbi:MAG: response regulator transcription factor, partial [Dehalococcoidia bacterium]